MDTQPACFQAGFFLNFNTQINNKWGINSQNKQKVEKFIKTDTRNQLDKKETSTVEDTRYRYTGKTNKTDPPEEETIPQKTLLEYALLNEDEYNIPD